MKLWVDTETYSATPIRDGTYRYTADTELLLFTWAVDDGPVEVWDATLDDMAPEDLVHALMYADEIWAQNAMFDRQVLQKHLHNLSPPLSKWRCTMVQAMSHALPGGMAQLSSVFALADEGKLATGKNLIQLFCKPRPKNMKLRRATRDTHPDDWALFIQYAKQDVHTMRVLQGKMPTWNYPALELDLWHLDQRMNDRGFEVDTQFAAAAVEMINATQRSLKDQVYKATDGEVESATQRDAMLEHIAARYGWLLDDLKGSTLDRLIADDGTPLGLRGLLELRVQASTTSAAKYGKLLKSETDGRLRGTQQFCGALRTARWGGRGWQPHNLPSRGLLDRETTDRGIDAILDGSAGMAFDDLMLLASSAIRGCITAAAGRKLVCSDLSNIEGRGLAWLAGEVWKLLAFAAFDRGEGADLYKLAYARAFGISVDDVDKHQRQVGKVMELALGFQGGVGAFVTFALAYGIDLEALANLAWDTLPQRLVEEARDFLAWSLRTKRPTFQLSDRAFVTCDVFKRAWREAHPATTEYWPALESAAREAIDSPGRDIRVRTVRFNRERNWLRIFLPSGRALCYPAPRIDDKNRVSYMGINQYSRKWTRLNTYGGKLAENITQGFARDVLAYQLPAIEAAGYPLVLLVHDEAVTEPLDESRFSSDGLSELLSVTPSWAPGLPLAASGFESHRYRKD